MDTDDTFMDLSPVPSLDLGSLLNDYEPLNPQEGEEEISLQEEKDTGTQTKLGDSEVQKDTKHVYGQEIPHDQKPVAKPLQVNHPDPHVEINQLQGRKTQQAIQKGHCTGLKQTAALSKQEVNRIMVTEEFKNVVKKFVTTRLYGFTEDVEAVIIEFLLENGGKLPTFCEFHSTWSTMRGTKGIVKLQEENEFKQKKIMRLENVLEDEKKKRKLLQQKLNEMEGESMLRSN